jgi:2-polyprenyl-6-methoxyphenol hydroxylase-like FAD-dependent oxidoreductase
VTILERSTPSSPPGQGACINVAPFHPPIIESLKQLGISSPIFEFFKAYDRTSKPWCKSVNQTSIQILRRNGSVKHAMALKGMVMGSTSWELLYNSLRANFDGKTENGFIDGEERKEGDGNARYLHGMRVLSLHDVASEGVEVKCVDTEGKEVIMTANLVVGADGASSTVRGYFLPELTREHVGYVAWRGTVAQDRVSGATREPLGGVPSSILKAIKLLSK